MHECGVGAYTYNFSAKWSYLVVVICEVSQLCWTNKSKIGRVEEQNQPLAFEVAESNLFDLVVHKCVFFEARGIFINQLNNNLLVFREFTEAEDKVNAR